MNWTQIILSSLATLAVVVGLATAGGIYVWNTYAVEARAGGWASHAMSREGARGGEGRYSTWCADGSHALSVAAFAPFIEAELELDEEQGMRFRSLAEKFETTLEELRSPLCSMQDEAPLTARVEQMRVALDAGASVLRHIEPELEAFYGALSSEQKARIDGALAQHRTNGQRNWQ